jgi:hypothetical protein
MKRNKFLPLKNKKETRKEKKKEKQNKKCTLKK